MRTILLSTLALFVLAVPASAEAKAKPTYYVSLGDSWSDGFQPLGPDQADIPTKKGYERTVYKRLKQKDKNLKLVELGCGGATTQSMIDGSKPCVEKRPYKSRSKATSQLTYAHKWLKAHRSRVRYVSVIIGGNDIAPCAAQADIATCVVTGINNIKKNLKVIAKGIRSGAGKKPHIVGSTYADVVLGQYVKSEGGKGLAQLSVNIFRDQINPTLKSAYAKQKIKFVDATAAFGGYIPFSQTTTLAPYGEIPVAVANICRYGWYCNARPTPDIHLKAAGYAKLGKLVYKKIK
jgi:lysophospholipase L1-like esterase